MQTPAHCYETDLDTLATEVRAHAGLTGKAPIGTLSDFIDSSDPVHGPGDDGAVVEIGSGRVVACGEALFPSFVAADPYGAGIAAVLANVNDVAAMGGIPQAIVNTIVGPPKIVAEAMRGMRDASDMYQVPIVGGHLTEHDGPPALSAFAVGEVENVLSMANVAPGQSLVFVCSLDGHMREDFPFFTSLDDQGPRLAHDIRLLSEAARLGLAVAAKDVSMAGSIGSLAMLLEFKRLGASVDLDLLPKPTDVDFARWLVCFPTYAFWLTMAKETAPECIAFFKRNGLEASMVGTVSVDPTIRIAQGNASATIVDLSTTPVTGLWTVAEN